MEIESVIAHPIIKVSGTKTNYQEDILVVEEPLQLQLQVHTASGRINKNIAVTMRTPGNDEELAAGFLFTEGIIDSYEQINIISHVNNDEDKILVVLNENVQPQLRNTERNFYATSSCGVCGKASIDAVKAITIFNEKIHFSVDPDVIYSLQDELKKQQQLFETTGGLHAAALFDSEGDFCLLREDVGRHNALDKLIGALFMNNDLPLPGKILLLSGRASFELVQKAAMAGIKMIAAVGAPSNLAVELAKENDITLIGFLRHDKMNIYCGAERIQL